MAPSSLSLFPAPPASFPRKTSLKKIKTGNITNATRDITMKGVAFQVTTSPRSAKVQSAAESIQHSLFCDPTSPESATLSPDSSAITSPASSIQGPIRRQSRTRRLSTRTTGTSAVNTPATSYTLSPSPKEDELAPLPSNSYFGPGSPPKRVRSGHLKRPRGPSGIPSKPQGRAIEIPITPVDEKTDNLSPLPNKTCFKPLSLAGQAEYSHSVRSTTSAASHNIDGLGHSSPMRSIFPRYDHTKPAHLQSYYPAEGATPPTTYIPESMNKSAASSTEQRALRRNESGVSLIDTYEHVPVAVHKDLQALWRASREEYPIAGRKVRFGLYQPPSNGKSLAIGTTAEDLIFTMERDNSSTMSGPKNYAVKKHCPTAPSSSPVMHLVIPDPKDGDGKKKGLKECATIFPQTAAADAISAVMNSPEAHRIATFDPTAKSVEAARFGHGAVAKARSRYGCSLVKKSREQDSLGAVTALYELRHPTLGRCPVTVTKSVSTNNAISGPRAKISLHHPSATPAAVASDSMNLAFLDFAHNACILDIPALLALESHYVIDTVVGTLLAVALIENDAVIAESVRFDPPPKTPVKPSKAQRRVSVRSTPSTTPSKRSTSTKGKKEEKIAGFTENEQVELPGMAKGALKVMELGFKATAWVVVSGVKVGLKVGTGVVERVAPK